MICDFIRIFVTALRRFATHLLYDISMSDLPFMMFYFASFDCKILPLIFLEIFFCSFPVYIYI